jgi:hypothetical protein
MLVLEDDREVLEPTRPDASGVGHLDAEAVTEPQQCGALRAGSAMLARAERDHVEVGHDALGGLARPACHEQVRDRAV